MDVKDTIEFIKALKLFSILEGEEINRLVDICRIKSVAAGDVVFNQGDPADNFYIVYSGKVRIVKKTGDGNEINLGVRTKKDHFGETALISDDARNATVRAAEDSVLISIHREAFEKTIFIKPEARQYFDKFIKSTAIQSFLKSSAGLSTLPPKVIQDLVSNFSSEFFRENEVVFRQDADPDKFYIVESGKLKVERWEKDNTTEIINFLRAGDFFGDWTH